jgi:hypothetical protein
MHGIMHDAAGNIKPQLAAALALHSFMPLAYPMQLCMRQRAARGVRSKQMPGLPAMVPRPAGKGAAAAALACSPPESPMSLPKTSLRCLPVAYTLNGCLLRVASYTVFLVQCDRLERSRKRARYRRKCLDVGGAPYLAAFLSPVTVER